MRIGERAAHDGRVSHGPVAIGHRCRSGFLQQSELGYELPLETLGDGRHRRHPYDRRIAGAPQNEIDDCRVVDHRLGVGHHDHRRDAAGGRCLRSRGKCLAMLVARLPGENAHVDEAGHQHGARAVYYRCRRSGAGRGDIRSDADYSSIVDQNAAAAIEAA